MPPQEKVTPETQLTLCLFNLKTISFQEIRPFDLQQEMALEKEAGDQEANFEKTIKRSKATTVLNEARMLDVAVDQWGLENKKPDTAIPNFSDLTPYLKAGSKLATNGGKDSLGNPFIIGDLNTAPRVSPATKSALSDSTGGDVFWGPYS